MGSSAKHNHGTTRRQQLCNKRGGYPSKVRRRHRHTRGSHVCPTLLQEPTRASLTYTSPLRRRTFTFHPYIHAELLQTARWRSPSFSIIAKLAPLWRHRWRQYLSIQRKPLSWIDKHNLCDFRIEYRSNVLCIIMCWRFTS